MAQFDVYRSPKPRRFPLLLDVQAGILARLSTRVVVPMLPVKVYGARPITRLHPVARFDSVDYVLVAHELAAIPAQVLGAPLGSLGAQRGAVIAALGLLFTGS